VIAAVALALTAGLAPAQSPDAPRPLAKGDTVAAFQGERLDGALRRVGFEQETVVLFFLSSCPTCHRMIPLWNSAYERRPKGLDVVAVMLDQEPPGFFMATPISFPVVRAPGRTPLEKRAFAESYKVHRVPITARIGPGGKVEDVGVGLLDPIRVGELFRP
jgi:thiol-disulfide isomerase/thioredoxin